MNRTIKNLDSTVDKSVSAVTPLKLVFCCRADNDLYCVLSVDGAKYPRYDSPAAAVRAATEDAGLLILADGYPRKTTEISAEVYESARKKNLRLYVEFPTSLPGIRVRKPRDTHKERGVVASDDFGRALPKMSILAINDCHFVEVRAETPSIVLAKVAGYDTAVFGLKETQVYAILFEHPRGRLLVATTKLSQFVTARYGPKKAWQAIWRNIIEWLQPGKECQTLEWVETVRPSYGGDERLPRDAFRKAIVRGINWHSKAKMLVHESWKNKYNKYTRARDKHGHMPEKDWPVGDGMHGVLEGVVSHIHYDGTQPIRWWLRSDSNGESALAFALCSKVDGDARSRQIAVNLLDWVYFTSGLFQKDETKANFGLVNWAHDSSALYGDNDIKIILSCIGTSAILGDDRWDEVLLVNILANYRTTGVNGFRGGSLSNGNVLKHGWQNYWRAKTVHYAPHYEAWIWASYLWLYHKTGYKPLLERTRKAIRSMMEAYPDKWRWTNGIQQERGRMLLTLAWLIRVDDQPEYRQWLKRIAKDMRKCQDSSGAIREELGPLQNGKYRPPQSNEEYGKSEASLIQQNGDAVADLLYTCNFSFLGLHEAYAATGDILYRRMADKLTEFLVRVQVKSEVHPELDGSWYHAFDFERWEYFGSNADHGWGAWSVEVGWTQGWVPTVLALRALDLNLWDMSERSKIAKHWEKYRELMLPEEVVGKQP